MGHKVFTTNVELLKNVKELVNCRDRTENLARLILCHCIMYAYVKTFYFLCVRDTRLN